MRTYDITPLLRTAIGFDRMDRLFDAAMRQDNSGGYPPYNIEKIGENGYRITMAVAGFAPADLDVQVEDRTLTVKGNPLADKDGAVYLHRGIAGRGFERRFELADTVRVDGARIENGLLHIDLVREVPERLRPRRIEIAGPSGQPAGAAGPDELAAA